MNYKMAISSMTFIGGIALIIFAVNSMKKISSAKADAGGIASAISGNPIGIIVGESLKGRASEYDASVLWCLYGGIVLAAVGGAMTLYYIRTKR